MRSVFLISFFVLILCTFAFVATAQAQEYEDFADSAAMVESDAFAAADVEAEAEFKFKDLWNKVKDPLRQIGKDKLKDLIGKLFEDEEVAAEEGEVVESDVEVYTETEAEADATCKQTTAALNVRSGPSTNNRILKTLASGTRVSVQSTSNGWANLGGGQYVSAQYLKNCASTPAPAPSSGSLSVATLRRIMTGLSESRANQLISHLNRALTEAKITTCPRKAAFLAQLAHESGQLQWFEEFASGAAYEGRRDLCNTHSGDGRRFKGRGPIQLTGRCNYTNAGKALGLDLVGNPAQVATFAVGFRTSAWFWNTRSLNSYADQNTQASFDQITRRINGGYNGKADRDMYWRRAKSVLGC